MSDLTYAGKIGIYPVIVKKNKLKNFIASISEAVRGLFLPPAKLRPKKIVTMFTNRKRVYTISNTKYFLLCVLILTQHLSKYWDKSINFQRQYSIKSHLKMWLDLLNKNKMKIN